MADKELRVDPLSREIEIPDDFGIFGVANDERVRTIPLRMNRRIDGEDLYSGYTFYIVYANATGEGDITPVSVLDHDDDTLLLEWTLPRLATIEAGTLTFMVCAKKIQGEEITNEYHTQTVSVEIEAGLEVEEADFAEPLEWLKTLTDACEKATADASEATEYIYRVAANAINEANTAIKVAPEAPRVRGDGMLWMKTDEAASEIVALHRWDADDDARALMPSAALLPSGALMPRGRGIWKEFRLAPSVLAQ